MTPEEATRQLFQAARSGNRQDAEAALVAGANLNARDDGQRTPLHCAVQARQADLSRLLIENGADLRAHDDQLQTALHCAAKSGLAELAQLLLERGANPAAQDRWRYTPFDWASLCGHADLASLLLNAARHSHASRLHMQRNSDDDLSRG